MERQLFAYAQMRQLRTLASGDLQDPLKISSKQERELFDRLSRAGFLAQVRRGLYLVPLRLPLGGRWSPDEILAVSTLMKDQNTRYQICGPNAFNRYGFEDQIPARLFIYNTRLSGDRMIGAVAMTLIKVADGRLGDVEEVSNMEGEIGFYSSRTRTLLDAVYDWSRFNTLPRAYDWIQKEILSGRVTPKQLVDVTLKYGDVGTIRRMGFFLQLIGIDDAVVKKLKQILKPTTSFIPVDPLRPRRGKVHRTWGILDNAA